MSKKESFKERKNKYEKDGAKLERKAMRGMDSLPDDEADKARRLRVVMEQLRDQGKLTQEEEEKLFGTGGYLDQAENKAEDSTKVVQIKEAPVKRSIWHHVGKWAAVAAIFCVSLFALTMTSEANREYARDTVKYLTGDEVLVKSRGGKDSVIRGVSEAEMRVDIKAKLNMEVPVFQYKPENMKLVKYEVYDDDRMVLIYYAIEGEKVVIYISDGDNKKHDVKAYDGNLIDTIFADYDDLPVDIFADLDENSDQKSYSARWEREKINYRFSGVVDKEEFYKILKKMTF